MRFFLILTLAAAASAQDVLKLLDWEKLAARAKESANVNLDGNMLSMAAAFLGGIEKQAGHPDMKSLVGKLKGVYVRSLEFEKEGEYSLSDIDSIRGKLTAAKWSPIVDVRGKRESSGVFVRTDGKTIQELVVLSAEPRELTVVNIVGDINPSELQALGGKFGIPDIHLQGGSPKQKKDDE